MSASQPSQKPPAPPAAEPPRAPTQERWDALSAAEQQKQSAALLSAMQDFEDAHFSPESNRHYNAKEEIRRTLHVSSVPL